MFPGTSPQKKIQRFKRPRTLGFLELCLENILCMRAYNWTYNWKCQGACRQIIGAENKIL